MWGDDPEAEKFKSMVPTLALAPYYIIMCLKNGRAVRHVEEAEHRDYLALKEFALWRMNPFL